MLYCPYKAGLNCVQSKSVRQAVLLQSAVKVIYAKIILETQDYTF